MYKGKMQRVALSLVAAALYLLIFQVVAFAQDDSPPSAAADEAGVLIVAVQPESVAAVAGLRRGDIVLSVNEIALNDAEALAAVIGAAGADATLNLRILHGDEERTVEVTLGERDGRAFLGITPYRPAPVDQWGSATITAMPAMPELPGMPPVPALPQMMPLPGGEGVEVSFQVMEVLPESPAALAGLQVGERIVAADGETFAAPQALLEVVRGHAPGDEVTLSVAAAMTATNAVTATRLVTVALAAAPADETAAYLGIRFAPLVIVTDMEMGTEMDTEMGNGSGGQRLRLHRFMPRFNQTAPVPPLQCQCEMGEQAVPMQRHFFFRRPAAPSGEDVIIDQEGMQPDVFFYSDEIRSARPAVPFFSAPAEGVQEFNIEIVDDQI